MGRAAAQRGHPLGGSSVSREAGRQHAGGHVDPLQAAAEHQEPPAVVAAHGGVGQARQDGGPLLHVGEQGVGTDRRRPGPPCAGMALWVAFRHSHISDEMASRAPRAFSRAAVSAPAIEVVSGVEGEHVDDVGDRRRRRRRAPRPSPPAAPGRRRPRRPTDPPGGGGCGRRGSGRCPRPARRTGPSSTATRRCGSARPPRPCCCCCCCWAAWGTTGPGSSGFARRQRVEGRGRQRAGAGWSAPAPGSASTQVSLEPPPWLEFTTRLPSGSATRVRPPGTTQTRSPSFTANGRRSMWRGRSGRPDVRRRRRQLHDLLGDPAPRVGEEHVAHAAQLRVGGLGPDHQAVAARAVHRLEDQLVEAGQDRRQLVRLVEAVGVDVGEQRLLARGSNRIMSGT